MGGENSFVIGVFSYRNVCSGWLVGKENVE
jgi:hypothetical protein